MIKGKTIPIRQIEYKDGYAEIYFVNSVWYNQTMKKGKLINVAGSPGGCVDGKHEIKDVWIDKKNVGGFLGTRDTAKMFTINPNPGQQYSTWWRKIPSYMKTTNAKGDLMTFGDTGTDEPCGVIMTYDHRGLWNKIWGGVKKVSLAIPRAIFMTIMLLNIGGLATTLKSTDKKSSSKILKTWKKAGGNKNKLEKAINKGSSRNPLKFKKSADGGGDYEELARTLAESINDEGGKQIANEAINLGSAVLEDAAKDNRESSGKEGLSGNKNKLLAVYNSAVVLATTILATGPQAPIVIASGGAASTLGSTLISCIPDKDADKAIEKANEKLPAGSKVGEGLDKKFKIPAWGWVATGVAGISIISYFIYKSKSVKK